MCTISTQSQSVLRIYIYIKRKSDVQYGGTPSILCVCVNMYNETNQKDCKEFDLKYYAVIRYIIFSK